MKAKVVNGQDWYKDFAGHVFPVKEMSGEYLEVFVEGCKEELLKIGVKLQAFKPKLRKADCVVFDALGFKVTPCKYCKKMSRKEMCTTCAEALSGINYLKALPTGKYLLKRIIDDTLDDKS